MTTARAPTPAGSVGSLPKSACDLHRRQSQTGPHKHNQGAQKMRAHGLVRSHFPIRVVIYRSLRNSSCRLMWETATEKRHLLSFWEKKNFTGKKPYCVFVCVDTLRMKRQKSLTLGDTAVGPLPPSTERAPRRVCWFWGCSGLSGPLRPLRATQGSQGSQGLSGCSGPLRAAQGYSGLSGRSGPQATQASQGRSGLSGPLRALRAAQGLCAWRTETTLGLYVENSGCPQIHASLPFHDKVGGSGNAP